MIYPGEIMVRPRLAHQRKGRKKEESRESGVDFAKISCELVTIYAAKWTTANYYEQGVAVVHPVKIDICNAEDCANRIDSRLTMRVRRMQIRITYGTSKQYGS